MRSSSIDRKSQPVRARRLAPALSLAAFSLTAACDLARADLKLCNGTSSRIGVALGFQEAGAWATEGWWNIPARGCETILRGAPPSQFLYVYAIDYDRGGEWAGTSFMCTSDKSFRIRETSECEKRGHRRKGFMEIDTGGAKDWTIQLSDPQ